VSQQEFRQFQIVGECGSHHRSSVHDPRRPFRMRPLGVLLTTAFTSAPASRCFLTSGSGSTVTTQGKFGAVSMLRRSPAQSSGVNRWASA
jgi:hypothetical protein